MTSWSFFLHPLRVKMSKEVLVSCDEVFGSPFLLSWMLFFLITWTSSPFTFKCLCVSVTEHSPCNWMYHLYVSFQVSSKPLSKKKARTGHQLTWGYARHRYRRESSRADICVLIAYGIVIHNVSEVGPLYVAVSLYFICAKHFGTTAIINNTFRDPGFFSLLLTALSSLILSRCRCEHTTQD